TVLASDPFDAARAAAAGLIAEVASAEGALDRAVITRCIDEDTNADVAAACRKPLKRLDPGTVAVSVYVVPEGEATPAPRAPFALAFADGFVRLGVTDERGSVFEHDAPRGLMRLAIPAPLAE